MLDRPVIGTWVIVIWTAITLNCYCSLSQSRWKWSHVSISVQGNTQTHGVPPHSHHASCLHHCCAVMTTKSRAQTPL